MAAVGDGSDMVVVVCRRWWWLEDKHCGLFDDAISSISICRDLIWAWQA